MEAREIIHMMITTQYLDVSPSGLPASGTTLTCASVLTAARCGAGAGVEELCGVGEGDDGGAARPCRHQRHPGP
eukprot:2573551-Rhodomonas_salina.1